LRKLWTLALGMALVAAGGCVPQGGDPNLSNFSYQEGDCGAGQEAGEIVAEPGALRFFGAFLAPTPCHRLEAMLQLIAPQHQIVLSIEARESESPCVQCLALIPYQGEIEGVAAGMWHVCLYHEDRLVVEGDYPVPAAP